MKHLKLWPLGGVFIIAVVANAIGGRFHAQNRVPPPLPPIQVDARIPASLKAFTSQSTAIVLGVVESRFPASERQSRLSTDSLVHVTRVLKGPPTLNKIVVAQVGGESNGRVEYSGQFELMKLGGQYVLFLREVPEKYMSSLPVREGAARYEILTYAGQILLDGDKLGMSPDLPFRADYSRQTPSQLLAEIEGYVSADAKVTK